MTVTLTENAALRIKNMLANQNSAVGLRLAVKSTGCSGLAYVVEFAEELMPEDKVFESHGVKLVVGSDSIDYLSGTEVDYGREGLNEGFKFYNPNVRNTCGCGESFSV